MPDFVRAPYETCIISRYRPLIICLRWLAQLSKNISCQDMRGGRKARLPPRIHNVAILLFRPDFLNHHAAIRVDNIEFDLLFWF